MRSRILDWRKVGATSERFIPGVPDDGVFNFDYKLHHARYALAARYMRGRVLDVACGAGYGSRVLYERNCELVVGVDVDPGVVCYAESHYAPGPYFVLADAQRLPFPDNGFSGVVSFETIEHLASPDMFLRELVRVTAPGATLVFSTPNYSGGRYSTPFHVREFRHDEFEKLLVQAFGPDILWMGQLDARKKKDLPQSILRRLVRVVEFVDPLNIRRFIPVRLRGPVTVYSLGIDSAPDEIFAWRPTAMYQIALVKKRG